ncbi:MAG: primosomal protein N', partial [Dehalococcoidia bacterium]
LDLQPGHLVRVPFGPRTLHGLVVRLTDTPHVDYTKPVLGLVHPAPLLDHSHLELARWVSDYYMAPLFDAIAPMLPPGLRSRAHTTLELKPQALGLDAAAVIKLSPGGRKLLAHLRQRRGPARLATLTRTLGPWVVNAARALVESGLAVETSRNPEPRVLDREVTVVRPLLDPAEAIALAETLTRAPKQAALLRRLAGANDKLRLASEARKEFGTSAVAALVKKGTVALSREPGPRRATTARVGEPSLLPTPPQQEALAAINTAQDSPSETPRTFLLQGITGSGKTEVYLQAIAHCLDRGKQAIVLVPELALTPQTMSRFEARFPGRVGALHSGLGPSQHWDEWWAAHDGERSVVIGSRSAIFSPQRDVGLIVIDEEHEWTYKQVDASPRYHTRDVALHLASITGAVVVLGSATPDLDSAYRAETGDYRLLRLPRRIERSGAPADLAEVSVVDMREELRSGNRGVFSRELRDALEETLSAGQQSILFLNRRGAAGIVECRNCGHVMRCWRCSTPYTYHAAPAHGGQGGRDGGMLVCHHCNRRRGVPRTCPNCRSPRIRYLGLGTQRLVDEVHALLPDARVLRWDRDAAPTLAAHARLYAELEAGKADVLIGTQMIAKGLDIPSVTLVGVVLADLGLHVPDFRAPERTFQLLVQVAGRAGRGAAQGRVVIQSYQPDNYAIAAAAEQDYGAFYEQEMTHRRAFGNPPLSRLARLLFAHSSEATARRGAQTFAGLLRKTAREWDMTGVDVVGPAPAYPPRARGAWRWHLLVRAPDPRILLDKVNVPPSWMVDIDPVNVL